MPGAWLPWPGKMKATLIVVLAPRLRGLGDWLCIAVGSRCAGRAVLRACSGWRESAALQPVGCRLGAVDVLVTDDWGVIAAYRWLRVVTVWLTCSDRRPVTPTSVS